MWKFLQCLLCIGVAAVGLLNIYILFILLPMTTFGGWIDINPEYRDALRVASQLGRFDIISALLGTLGIMIGLGALVSFGYIRYRARQEALDEARQAVNELLPQLVPQEVAAHMDLLGRDGGADIAEHVDPEANG